MIGWPDLRLPPLNLWNYPMTDQDSGLLDGDILAFKAASLYQEEFDFGDGEPAITTDMEGAKQFVARKIDEYIEELDLSSMIVCLSDDENNFRKKVLPSYKGNRKGARPELLYPLKEWMLTTYASYRKQNLEADDVMGILSTHPKLLPGRKIIISEDKDMQTIPGWLWNPEKHKRPIHVTTEDADAYWLYQTLIGDTTDGYKGCPKVGSVRATEELTWCCSWDQVVAVYIAQGHTQKDALQQARCARILRYTDYNFKKQEVRLWRP